MNFNDFKIFCEGTPLCVHQSQFENKWLLSKGIEPNIIDDTRLLAYLYDERLPLDLESLCLRFDIGAPFKEEYGAEVAFLEGPELAGRNTKDAQRTIKLRDALKPLLSQEELFLYNKVLLPGARTMARIELQGLCFSPERIQALVKELKAKILALDLANDEIIKAFQKNVEGEFNINSPVQRSILIYDLLGYTPLPYRQAQTESGAPSTQLKVLKKMQELSPTETLGKLIKFSAYTGWKEKYEEFDKFCERCNSKHTAEIDGKHFIFSSLGLGLTSTGRIASSHVNLQNLPAREGSWTRKIFIPREEGGMLVEADYKGIELRLLAGVSGDAKLLEDFAKDKDPHNQMAMSAFGIKAVSKKQRDEGKTLNYAIPFGSGPARIAYETGRSMAEVKIWIRNYWREHPQLKKWLDAIPQKGIVISPTGMKRHTETWTQGRNFPIQNSAWAVLMIALNRMDDLNKYLVDLCIHDSMRIDLEAGRDIKKTVDEIRDIIEFKAGEVYSWLPIPLPVDFKTGRDWGHMEDYNAN